MGTPTQPQPVKFILGLIYACKSAAEDALDSMNQRFGAVAMECAPFPFDFTDYYRNEMGAGLTRKFVSFHDLIQPTLLPDIKLITNDLEKELAAPDAERRAVNLDPGYLSPANLILATTKEYSHRPYLRDGIYADLVYLFRHGTFTPLEWTYPDYRDPRSIEFFNGVRKTYMKQLPGI